MLFFGHNTTLHQNHPLKICGIWPKSVVFEPNTPYFSKSVVFDSNTTDFPKHDLNCILSLSLCIRVFISVFLSVLLSSLHLLLNSQRDVERSRSLWKQLWQFWLQHLNVTLWNLGSDLFAQIHRANMPICKYTKQTRSQRHSAYVPKLIESQNQIDTQSVNSIHGAKGINENM